MATYNAIRYNFIPPTATTSAQVGSGAQRLIKSIDVGSGTGTVSFVHGSSDVVFDGTHETYLFKWSHIHPSSDDGDYKLQFQATTNGSDYGVTATQTYMNAQNDEAAAGSYEVFAYDQFYDLDSGTGFMSLNGDIGADNDQAQQGYMWIWTPNNTTFHRRFMAVGMTQKRADSHQTFWSAGYFNSTTAITGLQFKLSGGNIDSGNIKLYGIS